MIQRRHLISLFSVVVVLVVTASPLAGQELIFADGFERGNPAAWSSIVPFLFLGSCPSGRHAVHRTGTVGVFDPDTNRHGDRPWTQYTCVPDESCTSASCGPFGICRILDGEAVCGCDLGYAGAQCERCAVGYEGRDGVCVLADECGLRRCSGQGSCVEADGVIKCICDDGAFGETCELGGPTGGPLRPPTRIAFSGIDTSVGPGEERMIEATLFGGGNVDNNLQWEIVEGPGSLRTRSGTAATFVAPPVDGSGAIRTATVQVHAACCPRDTVEFGLTLEGTDGIGATGVSQAVMEPLDQAILDFMRYRCVGGATLGVNVFGKQVYARGFGSLAGAPTSDPGYLAACGDTYDASNVVPGFLLPGPAPVLPTTPMRIGSNSKAVAAAITRKALKNHLGLATDSAVEALLLSDPANDLLPASVADVVQGVASPPVALSSLDGNTVDCSDDNPCPFGGLCIQPMGGGGVCTLCPVGRSGFDCSIVDAWCPDLSSQADARWQQVTVGHLLGHRSGMPRSAPSATGFGYPNLAVIRGIDTIGGWTAQESLLTSDTGFPAGDFTTEFPAFSDLKLIWPNSVFVPRLTTEEALLPRLGACLAFSPGSTGPGDWNEYSNTAYAMLGTIAEHVSNQVLAAQDGKPAQHTGSLLAQFLVADLGLPGAIPETAGLYFSQNVDRLLDQREPLYRVWDGSAYYSTAWDGKRPFCRVGGGDDCFFTDWIANPEDDRQRPSWDFPWDFPTADPKPALRGFNGGAVASTGAPGGFAATPEAYLRFMAKFWVGGAGSNPRYGESRCGPGGCVWGLQTTHNGARDGTVSWVMQLGGAPADLTLPPIVNGRITDDFANLADVSCQLPAGVDIFVTINTGSDKKCTDAEDYTCDDAYGALADFILWGACSVQWPVSPFELWPPGFGIPSPDPDPILAFP